MSKHWSKEDIYDNEISPLMAKIIAICKEHDMPLAATVQYANEEDGGAAYCTTMIPGTRSDERVIRIIKAMLPERPFALAETIVTNPDGSKTISIRRVS